MRCITLSDDEIIGGEYYENCVVSTITDRKYDPVNIKGDDDDVLAKKLWILSETIIGSKGFKLNLWNYCKSIYSESPDFAHRLQKNKKNLVLGVQSCCKV